MTDLVPKIRAGDEKAFEYLKDQWSNKLKIFARSYVRNENISEDLIQDTFIKLWEVRHTLDKEEYLGTYLFTIVKNKCLDYLKHKTIQQKYKNSLSEDYYYLLSNIYALEDSSIDIISEHELKDALFNAIKKMPHPRREIFIMSRFRNMKNQEIADELSLSVKTVEYHISKSISFLRDELKNYYILIYFLFLR